MARPQCQLCDQPATVHETLVGPDGPDERHYCKAHGGPLWGACLPKTRPEAEPLIRRWADDRRRDPRDRG